MDTIEIRLATREDAPLLLKFISGLADYEKLAHEVTATEAQLAKTLFGPKPVAESIIAFINGQPGGFALFFHNYSTFLAKPGLYLEDLFVLPELRGRGIGKALFIRLAKVAVERDCGRFEWSALDWNEPAIRFYEAMGASAMTEWTTFRLTGDALSAVARKG
jgi:GNAT superfamily N-acetyltransferase